MIIPSFQSAIQGTRRVGGLTRAGTRKLTATSDRVSLPATQKSDQIRRNDRELWIVDPTGRKSLESVVRVLDRGLTHSTRRNARSERVQGVDKQGGRTLTSALPQTYDRSHAPHKEHRGLFLQEITIRISCLFPRRARGKKLDHYHFSK